jgi:hypothetical protein
LSAHYASRLRTIVNRSFILKKGISKYLYERWANSMVSGTLDCPKFCASDELV